MALLEQFFRLREPAWAGRVVTLGELAARCPASAVVKQATAPAPPVPTPVAPAAVAPAPAKKNGSSRLPRKTGDASVIAPVLRPPLSPPPEDVRSPRRSGPCLEDPSLPPLQLRAQVAETSVEVRPLVLGQMPAAFVSSPLTELRQITPPPVGVAPLQKPALGAPDALDLIDAADLPDATNSASEEVTSVPAPETEVEGAPPEAAQSGVRLEIVAEAGADVEALLAYLRDLPGVTEARRVAQLSQDAAD